MSVRSVDEQEQFLVRGARFRKLGIDGAYHRFEAPGCGPVSIIDLHHEPTRPHGTGRSVPEQRITLPQRRDRRGAGRAEALYEELGYTDASDSRIATTSTEYVRSPGAFSSSARPTSPAGSTSRVAGGSRPALNLPPWYEEKREDILTMLEPITVPEANRPAARRGAQAAGARARGGDAGGRSAHPNQGRIHYREFIIDLLGSDPADPGSACLCGEGGLQL